MDLLKRLEVERRLYIEKYNRTPNVIFVSHSLYSDLDFLTGGLSLYNAAPTHFWGADVIMVSTPNYTKFAEHNDVKKAIDIFQKDKSLETCKVRKTKTIIGSVGNGIHNPSKMIDLEPVEFSKEEIEIYLMQS